MTEQTKAVFSDPKLLREKLGEYLDTTNTAKIERYALAAEKFFAAGGREGLKSKATWSWAAFFVHWAFFLYRKVNNKAALYFILISFAGIFAFIPMIFAGMYAKYHVIKRFEVALDSGEAMFKYMSGKAMWVVWLIGILNVIVIGFIAGCIYFMGVGGFLMAMSGEDTSMHDSSYEIIKDDSPNLVQNKAQNNNISQNSDTQAQKEQIIKDLYAKYMINQEPNQPLLALLSKNTKMLWDKAENNDDGMICLEFDPVIDGQDWDAKELEKTLKISSLPNGNVLAQFANFGEKKQVEYNFICDEKCTIDDLFINSQDGRFALSETLKSCLTETQNEANDPLENLLKQADEMDKKLNEYYKQIMKGLEGEKKDKFKNAQRAWIKFATAAEETRQSPAHLLNARLSILEIQVNFLKAVIDGKTPKVADNESVKYYENEIAQFLQNINDLADYQRQSVSEANKAWSQYAKLKKDAATMMGLDGDEIYRGECKFWAEFLSYIN